MGAKFGEIAGIDNGRDITRGFIQNIGMYIPTQDKILNLKSGGDLSLYEQVAQDDRVKSCLQQRFAGLTSKEIEVLPGGDKRIDKQAADHLKMQLDRLNWDNTTEKMQWGVFYGYSIAEMLWAKEDDKVIIQDIRVRNRRRFRFGIDQLPLLISIDNPLGETLPEQKFWHFSVGADHDDEPYGLGLAHWLYWLTYFKRNDLRWWITFLENFADPSTLGTYPAGATPQEKATLEGAVKSLGKSKWAIKPEGMLVELVEASRSGTADYEAMYKSINEAISQVILSQNMTTESGSSESQARVHQDVGDSVIESDDALISGSFNDGPATWLTNWNFPGAAVPIVRRKLEPEEDLKASADRDKIIVDMGFPANPEYIVEKYGEGFKQLEPKPISLNAGEVTAFITLITEAKQSGWSPDMVRTSLQIAFPHVPDALLDKMSASMKAMPAPGAAPNNPQPATPSPQTPTPAPATQTAPKNSPDDAAAMFATFDDVDGTFEFKMKEGTTKEKNGKTYVLVNSRWTLHSDHKQQPTGKSTKKPLSDQAKKAVTEVKAASGVESKAKLEPNVKATSKTEKIAIPQDAKLIGNGHFGAAYLGEDGLIYKKEFVPNLKGQKLTMEMQNKAYKLGVAPQVIKVSRDIMVMEKAEGETLDKLRKTRGKKDEVSEAEESGLKAVLKLHANGMVHHDLHDGNIMYSKVKGVSLIDFGLCQTEGKGLLTTDKEMERYLKFAYRSPKSPLAKEVALAVKKGTYKQFLQQYK